MKLGYSLATASIFGLEQAFRSAEGLGLEFIELSWEFLEMTRLPPAEHVRTLVRATGVETTIHLPFVDLNLASPVPRVRRMSVMRVQGATEYAAEVGSSCGVLHSGQNHFYYPEAESDALAALRQSFAELQGSPIRIALENLPSNPRNIVRGPEALCSMSREFGFNNCLDFGHAHVEGQTGFGAQDTIQNYLDHLGEHIVHIHLHGNDGTADQHRATTEGTLDLERYAAFLREFPGTICLEVAGEAALERSVRHLKTLTQHDFHSHAPALRPVSRKL